jgi:hypothetical protein
MARKQDGASKQEWCKHVRSNSAQGKDWNKVVRHNVRQAIQIYPDDFRYGLRSGRMNYNFENPEDDSDLDLYLDWDEYDSEF